MWSVPPNRKRSRAPYDGSRLSGGTEWRLGTSLMDTAERKNILLQPSADSASHSFTGPLYIVQGPGSVEPTGCGHLPRRAAAAAVETIDGATTRGAGRCVFQETNETRWKLNLVSSLYPLRTEDERTDGAERRDDCYVRR